MISNMPKRNIKGQQHIGNMKSTCNSHGFEFFHIMQNGEICIISHNPLLLSGVYRRIMTAAFHYYLCNNRDKINIKTFF